MRKRLVITQSNYIPWKGYFDLIASAQECILYDTVQYTKQDWRNRNRIKTPIGPQWLTIPVIYDQVTQRICDTRIADRKWAKQHWRKLSEYYRKAPYFYAYESALAELYQQCEKDELLSLVNARFISFINQALGVEARISATPAFERTGDKNQDLIALCELSGATHYLVGPKARSYIDESQFKAAGITVEWMQYGQYPEYSQLYPPFTHEVSVLDLLFSVGPAARQHMRPLP